jgi:hypothetical protein
MRKLDIWDGKYHRPLMRQLTRVDRAMVRIEGSSFFILLFPVFIILICIGCIIVLGLSLITIIKYVYRSYTIFRYGWFRGNIKKCTIDKHIAINLKKVFPRRYIQFKTEKILSSSNTILFETDIQIMTEILGE